VTSNDGIVSPIDVEMLADYLDGLLPAGPAAAVERRIESDPRWAIAAEQLRRAAPAVMGALRDTHTEPMPEVVFDRLMRALPDRGDATINDRTDRTVDKPAAPEDRDAPPARVISLDRRRGRRSIWSNVAKVAAALIVLAGIGTGIGFGLRGGGINQSSSTSAGSAEKAPPAASAGDVGGVAIPVTASGHDYTGELTRAPSTLPAPHVQSPILPTPNGAGTDSAVPNVPPILERLANGGLPACLAQLQDQFGLPPVRADFGSYAAQPVVVVTLSGPDIIAVGADCGLPGHGADVLATGH
jgi:anti-sigma factor RsiW